MNYYRAVTYREELNEACGLLEESTHFLDEDDLLAEIKEFLIKVKWIRE